MMHKGNTKVTQVIEPHLQALYSGLHEKQSVENIHEKGPFLSTL
jgi:hypothetical protein